jgi:hypothetical protein
MVCKVFGYIILKNTGIATEHSPPKVVCSKESKPQAITSARSATVTIISGGNATGNHIPNICLDFPEMQLWPST